MPIQFIEMMLLDARDIKDLEDPPEPVQPTDQVLGELSPILRQLFTYWKQIGRKAGALDNEIKWGEKSEEKITLAHELRSKTNIINGIFWTAVWDEFHLWGIKDKMAYLCQGFQVVLRDRPRQAFPFFNFMGGNE